MADETGAFDSGLTEGLEACTLAASVDAAGVTTPVHLKMARTAITPT